MFLRRKELLDRFPIQEGVKVYSRDGEKLGKVVSLEDDCFTVQKGLFFPRDYTARYDDILDYKNDEVYLNQDKNEFTNWQNESYTGWSQVNDINAGTINATPTPEYRDRYADFRSNDSLSSARPESTETRIPIAEEQLEAQKTVRETGQVKIRKIVHSELKHFTVPVMKEEVRVERVPASEGAALGSTAQDIGTFEEKVVNVPVMEEEVTISKRPVVKEEVRVTKERQTEQRDITEEVRKEDVDIQREGTTKRKAG